EAQSSSLGDGEPLVWAVNWRPAQVLGETESAQREAESVANEGPFERTVLVGTGPFERIERQLEAKPLQIDVADEVPRLVEYQRGRARPEGVGRRRRCWADPLDYVVQVHQQPAGTGWRGLDREGVHSTVVPTHLVEIRVGPDRLD